MCFSTQHKYAVEACAQRNMDDFFPKSQFSFLVPPPCERNRPRNVLENSSLGRSRLASRRHVRMYARLNNACRSYDVITVHYVNRITPRRECLRSFHLRLRKLPQQSAGGVLLKSFIPSILCINRKHMHNKNATTAVRGRLTNDSKHYT